MNALFLTFTDAERGVIYAELLQGDLAGALAHAAKVQRDLPAAAYCQIEPIADAADHLGDLLAGATV